MIKELDRVKVHKRIIMNERPRIIKFYLLFINFYPFFGVINSIKFAWGSAKRTSVVKTDP